MGLVVLSDFDGTIAETDTAAFVLHRFAEGKWRIFDEQLERGEISLEECMRRQFSLVRATQTEILKELDQVTDFRPYFEGFVEFCETQSIPVIVVSAGLDFYVRHSLALHGWVRSVRLRGPRARCTAQGIKFTFPKLRYLESVNFKDDLVRYYRKQGRKAVYIGDGLIDYHAIRNADLSFAIKGSDLAHKCKRNKIPHIEIWNFQQAVDGIRRYAGM